MIISSLFYLFILLRILNCPPQRVDVNHGDQHFSCEFDAVLGPTTTQMEMFENVSDIILNSVNGFNSTLFCYGQTGSGKTYTLVGPDADGTLYDVTSKYIPNNTGVLPRAVIELFKLLQTKRRENKEYEASLYLSIVQIYNEQVRCFIRNIIDQFCF